MTVRHELEGPDYAPIVMFANSLGTGPWFDNYLGGLTSTSGLGKQISDALNGTAAP